MSLPLPAAQRLFAPLTYACAIRPARESDRSAITRLMKPHIASGALLPREADPAAFLVAEVHGELLGCVALTVWTAEVVELGSLVSERPGLGRLLVEAAVHAAAAAGFRSVVALTGAPVFFERCGFQSEAVAPWAVARGLGRASEDVATKAERCRRCPRLGGCQQVLLRRSLRPSVAASAAAGP